MTHPLISAMANKGFEILEPQDPRSILVTGCECHHTCMNEHIRLSFAVQIALLTTGCGVLRQHELHGCWLSALIVDEAQQNQGHGTRAMEAFLNAADHLGITVYLEPVPVGRMSWVELLGFCARFGFKSQTNAMRVLVREAKTTPQST